MKTIVVVIVYNRFDNMVRWINCFSQCEGGELVIIHNYENEEELKKYQKYCIDKGVKYVPRVNVGFDIGAFQDVCRERLNGFDNDWHNMIWCTDDTIPMSKNFVNMFLEKLSHKVLPCMEISKEVTPHIRTTGFMITKSLSKQIGFQHDKITTKEQCYFFEHRGRNQTLYHQVIRLGAKPAMVAPLPQSPLWDIGNKRHLKMQRWGEYDLEFNRQNVNDKVTVICPIYNTYPEIIGGLINQTHKNWELLLIHDGKSNIDIHAIVKAANDKRIKYWETKERVGTWGHKLRRDVLESLKDSDSGFVVITNPDNHHVPVFLDYMIKPMLLNANIVATYCSSMVHSYKNWDVIPCSLKRGYIDCAGAVIRKDVACSVGFNHVEEHSADWYFFQDIIKAYGVERWLKVNGTLLIHN